MKRALVTGSAGFVGRHMVAELLRRGWEVDESESDCYDAHEVFRTREDVFDLVVHAAATAPHRAAIDNQPMNLALDLALDAAMFEWAVRTGQRRVLYLSSSAAYPVGLQSGSPPYRLHEWDLASLQEAAALGLERPLVPVGALGPDGSYGWTKLTGEKMAAAARDAGVAVHVVRPFSGYGEDQGEHWPFGAFVARAHRQEDPFTIWGDGRQVRDWIHIDDVVAGALAVVDADVREPVNLCTGVGTSMRELAAMVCAEAGYQPAVELREDAPAGVAYRVGDPARMLDLYRPKVSLAEGVRRAMRSLVTTEGEW